MIDIKRYYQNRETFLILQPIYLNYPNIDIRNSQTSSIQSPRQRKNYSQIDFDDQVIKTIIIPQKYPKISVLRCCYLNPNVQYHLVHEYI